MKMTEQEQIKALRKAKREMCDFTMYLDFSENPIGSYLSVLCQWEINGKAVSQRALGRLLDSTSSAYINNIIAGRKKMGMERKTKLAEVLKLNKAERNSLYEAKS